MMRRLGLFTALLLILSGGAIRAQAIGYCSGNWCQVDQNSIDPVTGTYLGYDGAETEAKGRASGLDLETEDDAKDGEEAQAPPGGRWVYYQDLGWTFLPAQ